MKTTLRYLNLNAQPTWHRQVEEQLHSLEGLTPINAAQVVLEHRKDAQPEFRVEVLLEVPGPGVHAQASRKSRERAVLIPGPSLQAVGSDSTLEAALLKATNALQRKIQARRLRHSERDRSQLQLSAISGRWTHAQPGRKP